MSVLGVTPNRTGTILNHPEPCSEPTQSVGKTMNYAKCLIQEPSWTIAGTMLNWRKPYTKTAFVLLAPSPIIILNKRRGDPWEASRGVFSIMWGWGVCGMLCPFLPPSACSPDWAPTSIHIAKRYRIRSFYAQKSGVSGLRRPLYSGRRNWWRLKTLTKRLYLLPNSQK